MFADDTKIFSFEKNGQLIQQDLTYLEEWSRNWLLDFHPDKCKQMIILKPREEHHATQRYFCNTALNSTTKEKDLGIIFDNHLNFKDHINTVIKKCNQTMGILRRTFINLTPDIFLPVFKALIRSKLEYGQLIWYPYNITDKRKIEAVQRRATKRINGFDKMSYRERLEKLKLPTLEYRRKRGDMIEVYKILNKFYDDNTIIRFNMAKTERRGHGLKIYKERVLRLDIRKFFFKHRVVNDWNSLPEYVVTAESLNSFKNRLDKHWNNIMYENTFT